MDRKFYIFLYPPSLYSRIIDKGNSADARDVALYGTVTRRHTSHDCPSNGMDVLWHLFLRHVNIPARLSIERINYSSGQILRHSWTF